MLAAKCIVTNITAYNNNEGLNGNWDIYNSIVYDNGTDFYHGVNVVYNSVWKTENSVKEKYNCTTNDPNLLWVNENGEPVSDISQAAYYILGGGSSAFGLADKSIIDREQILETIFDGYDGGDDEAGFRNFVTEEYIANMMMYDQLGNTREFNGDRYDAGSISENSGISNGIASYAPKKAANYGKSSIVFYGYGFDNNSVFSLKKLGETDIVADTMVIEYSGSKCSATFNFHNKKTGKWDIVVNLNGTIITIEDGFELEPVIEPKIELEILGPSNIRNARMSSYTIKYSNKGNINVYCLPIIVEIITGNDVTVEVKEQWDYIHTEGVYTDKYAIIDGEVHRLDTLHVPSGENQYTTFVTPLIPIIPPYGTDYLTFDVKFIKDGIADDPIEILAYSFPPFVAVDLESPGVKMVSTDESGTLWDCLAPLTDMLGDIGKNIPGVGCALQVAESAYSIANTGGGKRKKIINAAWETGNVIVVCGANMIPAGTAAKAAIQLFNGASTIRNWSEYPDKLQKCANGPNGPDNPSRHFGRLLNSKDPNDKIGPVSESGSTWFNDRTDFTYVINFENSSEATAPAAEVWVTDTLDLNVFNINTFEAGIMKIGDRIIDYIPFETQNYTWSIDMNPEMDLILEINLKLDKSKGIATWYFKSIDPATGELPTDALRGFLPPNDDEGAGQGFVMFTIKLKEGLPDDVTIANSASIVFDFNDPIITPEWVNQKDLVPPVSTMLRPSKVTGEIELKWQGEDNPNGSGVYCYDIYMKKDDGAYEPILIRTTATSAMFTVEEDVKYSFYAIATDHAGNREPDKTKPDITIPFNDLPFDTYAATKWNNTFMLNLRKLADDGYDVSACQWFKNNQPIGEGFTYSAGPKITDQLETGVIYYFQITTNEGDELFSTNKIIGTLKNGLCAYPNPVPQGQNLTIEGTTEGALVEVFNAIGTCVSRTTATGNVTQLTLSLPAGFYIVRSNNETVKVVIK